MSNPPYESIGGDTLLIDTGLYRPQMAGCYLIRDRDELAIIDCGTHHSVPRILEAIHSLGADPGDVRWIIPTHVHLDHAGGAGLLARYCRNASVVLHPRGLPHMVDPSRLQAGATEVYGEKAFARDFGALEPIPEERCIAAADDQAFELGERRLQFMHTPGHANHHGCILDLTSAYLFTGDTFGLAYRELAEPAPYLVATTTPVAFDPDAWQTSLDRLLAVQAMAVCLTHYGKYADPAALAPQLRASIQAHVDIALREEPETGPGREQRLERAVSDLLIRGAVAHSGVSERRAQQLLANDIQLNAQGLDVWLKRRAKRRQG